MLFLGFSSDSENEQQIRSFDGGILRSSCLPPRSASVFLWRFRESREAVAARYVTATILIAPDALPSSTGSGDACRAIFVASTPTSWLYFDKLLTPLNRFGACRAEIIRDHITGEGLNYAFVEFEAVESCEEVWCGGFTIA